MPSGTDSGLSPRRVMVVGAGLMGRWHAHAVRLAGSHVVAIVDNDVAAAKELAGRSGGRAYTSLGGCLQHERVDIAHICSPTDTHEVLIRECIAAGVSAFVEKPLATSADASAALVQAAATHGVWLCPTHQYAFQRSIAGLVGHLPQLQALTTVDLVFQTAGGGQDSRRWARIVGDILPHPISILQKLFPLDAIDHAEWMVSGNAHGTWQLTATIQQALVRILLSVQARPTCARASVAGTGGSFTADLFHDYGVWTAGVVSRRSKIAGPGVNAARHLATYAVNLASRAVRGEPAYPGLQKLVKEFHRLDPDRVPITPAQILQVARLRDWFLSCAPENVAAAGAREWGGS